MADVEQTEAEQLPAGAAEVKSTGKWWLVGVLFLATVLTYLDRQTVVFCKPQISAEFNLDNEQFGELLSAFRWTYALMQLPAGIMADRLPLRTTYGLAVGLWSLAGAGAAFVLRFPSLLVTRGVLGMGECFNWPCASRIVANAFPPSDRSLASGIFNSGAAIGALVAPTLVGYLALAFGWRAAFFAVGALGLLWLVLWTVVTAPQSLCHAAVKAKRNLSWRGSWTFAAAFLGLGVAIPAVAILRGPALVARPLEFIAASFAAHPAISWGLAIGLAAAGLLGFAWSLVRWRRGAVAFWMLILITLTVNPCWYFVTEWVVAYLQESRKVDAWQVPVLATAIFLVADLGNVVSGGIIKALTARGWSLRTARSSVMIGVAGLIAPVALVTRVESTFIATLLLALAGMGLTSLIANFTACQQDLSFKRVGVMSGVVGMVANIFTAVANPRIGAYIDRTQSYSLLFVCLGLLPLVSVAAILVFDSVVHGGKATIPPSARKEGK